MEGPDYRHVVENTACGREVVGEVGDEQAHGGDIWIDEGEIIMIAELDEGPVPVGCGFWPCLGGRHVQLGVEPPYGAEGGASILE